MRFHYLIPVAFLGLPMAGLSAEENTPPGIAPSSNWVVDFAPNKCRMFRTFGEGKDRHFLSFEQHWPSQRFGMTVAGRSFKRWRSRVDTRLSFNGAQEPFRTEPFRGNSQTFGAAMIYSSVSLSSGSEYEDDEIGDPMAMLAPELGDNVEFVRLRQGRREVRLATGPLGEAFKVLNQCTEDLLRDWGLDVEKHKTRSRGPDFLNEEAVAERIGSAYPTAAGAVGRQAIFRLRLMIDATGKVTECILNEATSADDFNSPACKEMQKAEFSPALDAEGKPFASYYAVSITYQMSK